MELLRRKIVLFESEKSEKSSLREKVFRKIREDILGGVYAPGDVIREATIASQLNVSRTPVREAIRQLELEGLVHSIPNKETVVTGVTEEDVRDIYMIRSRLEGLASRWAAERMSEEDIGKLQEVLELTEFYANKKDVEHIEMLDHRFHDIIYSATKSRILTHVLSDFHTYVQKTRMKSIATPGRAERLLAEHTAIFEAIKEKDADRAESLTHNHIQKATQNLHLRSEK